MKKVPVAAAGILFGFILLPVEDLFWIPALIIWPFLLQYSIGKSTGSFTSYITSMAFFGCARYLTQYFWIIESLFNHSHLPETALIFSLAAALFWILIPWLILSAAAFILFEKTSLFDFKINVDTWLPAIFPLMIYTTRWIHNQNPFYGLPGGELIEKDLIFSWFHPLIPFLGTNGTDLLLLSALIWMLLALRKRLNRFIYALLLLVLICSPLLVSQPKQTSNPKESTKISILTWPKSLGENPPSIKVLEYYLKQLKQPDIKRSTLIILPESALPGLVESGTTLKQLYQSLENNQQLLFGSTRKELHKEGFSYFNAAYLLNGGDFDFQVYRKNIPVPFGEYSPTILSRKLPMLLSRKIEYLPGTDRTINTGKGLLAVGICFEGIQDNWFKTKEDDHPEFYVFLNREFLFSQTGKKALYHTSKAKAAQTGKPVIRAVNGGYSDVFQDGFYTPLSFRNKNVSIIHKNIYSVSQPSFYFRYFNWIPVILSIIYSMTAVIAIKKRD